MFCLKFSLLQSTTINATTVALRSWVLKTPGCAFYKHVLEVQLRVAAAGLVSVSGSLRAGFWWCSLAGLGPGPPRTWGQLINRCAAPTPPRTEVEDSWPPRMRVETTPSPAPAGVSASQKLGRAGPDGRVGSCSPWTFIWRSKAFVTAGSREVSDELITFIQRSLITRRFAFRRGPRQARGLHWWLRL